MALTQIIDAMIAGMSASKLSGRLPAANSIAGGVVKVTQAVNSTRASMAATGGASNILSFWSFTYAKAIAGSNLHVNGFLPGWGGNNGGAIYWWRINSGSWQRCGGHNYITSYGNCDTISGFIDASALAAGSYTIELGYSSSTGFPMNIVNPNATDHVELTYGSQSLLNIFEVLP